MTFIRINRRIAWYSFRQWLQMVVLASSPLAALVTFVPPQKITRTWSAVYIVCWFSFPIGYAFFKTKTKMRHLSLDDVMPSLRAGPMRLECPCDSKRSYAANQLAREFYKRETCTYDLYEQLRLKNRNILVCLLDSEGIVVGYFDVYPVAKDFMDQLIAGKVTEQDITHEQIQPPPQAKRLEGLYLAGLAVRDPESFSGKKHACMLVWGVSKYLLKYYRDRDHTIYAIASTGDGERLLQKLKFSLATPAGVRKDKHNIYKIDISKPILQEFVATLRDWTPQCAVSWEGRH